MEKRGQKFEGIYKIVNLLMVIGFNSVHHFIFLVWMRYNLDLNYTKINMIL